MASRTRSVRTRIITLLLIPLLSLGALWGYAAFGAIEDARNEFTHKTVGSRIAKPAQDMTLELGKERVISALALTLPPGAQQQALAAQRPALDAKIALFRKAVGDDGVQASMDAEMKIFVADMIKAFDRLGSLRAAVDSRSISRLTAIQDYSSLLDAQNRLYDKLSQPAQVRHYRQVQSVIAGGKAMEMINREISLIVPVLTGGKGFQPGEYQAFSDMVNVQRSQWALEKELNGFESNAADLKRLMESPAFVRLRTMEDQIRSGARGIRSVDPRTWQATSQEVLLGMHKAHIQFAAREDDQAAEIGSAILLRLYLVGGLGLLAVIVSVVVSVRFGRRLTGELVGLRTAAHELADERLPSVVDRLRRGVEVNVAVEAPPIRHGKIAEVASVAQAFSTVQHTAIEAAVGQAELRKAVGDVFLKLARRNQSLLHRQLAMLDDLEHRADADELADLFKLDHLTTRMRRHAESLIILSGAAPGRGWRNPVAMIDVLRGAAGEIEDYARVKVRSDSRDGLAGTAVADVIHLIAELIENAAAFSPPNTQVLVKAEVVGTGFVVEVEDRGLGMSPAKLAEHNERLLHPPEFDLADTDQLGLFVVARLAVRHDIRVSLQPSPYGGITAIVLLPHSIVVPEAEFAAQGQAKPAPEPEPVAEPRPDLRGVSDSGAWQAVPPPSRESTGQYVEDSSPRTSGAHRRPEPFAPPAPPAPPVPQAPAPFVPQAPPVPQAGPAEPRPTHAGLPVRTRQTNLAPQLRSSAPAGPPPPAAADTEVVRSPEEARSLMSSMQQGWRRGRATPIDPSGPSGNEGA